MYDWHEIGALDDIPRLGSRVVNTPHGDVAIFRTADDQVFACAIAVRTKVVHCRKVSFTVTGSLVRCTIGCWNWKAARRSRRMWVALPAIRRDWKTGGFGSV